MEPGSVEATKSYSLKKAVGLHSVTASMVIVLPFVDSHIPGTKIKTKIEMLLSPSLISR